MAWPDFVCWPPITQALLPRPGVLIVSGIYVKSTCGVGGDGLAAFSAPLRSSEGSSSELTIVICSGNVSAVCGRSSAASSSPKMLSIASYKISWAHVIFSCKVTKYYITKTSLGCHSSHSLQVIQYSNGRIQRCFTLSFMPFVKSSIETFTSRGCAA